MATNETNEATAPEAESADAEVQALTEKLTKAEQQKDDMLRTLAEYENSRKRSARDLELERKFAHGKLAGDLLPALDNLDRAVAAARKAGDNGPLVQGVMATQAQLLDILKRHGINLIETLGQPFDPNVHQAVQMMPSAEAPANTVIQVLQQGYQIYDRILRPASVIIASNPDAK
ncbi:MAG: nucleotide exchange factor GrpE [Planctomycetes bacterium]|nr:nucleotide exchange factor GrpE [Planctomycetota bacterium]